MKKLLLAIAALASTAAMNATNLVTPTGERTEFITEASVLTGVGRASSYDVTKVYDYYIDGSTIYICNFVTGKGYIQGTIDGTTITVDVPQAVYEEDGVTYYVKTADFGGSGNALKDEQFTMTYYPVNGRINCLSYGVGIYAGDNTQCERAVCQIGLRTNRNYSDLFELARIAETSDGQVYIDKVNARYLDKAGSDYLAVEGMFPGSEYGQMIDDWGSKWRFTDSQYTGLDDAGAHTFTAMLAGNGTLTTGHRTFTKTVDGDITEWNMDEGQEIIAWHIVSNDESGAVADRWRIVTSLKLSTDLSLVPSTAIDEVEAAATAVEVARYNLAGQRVSNDTQGVVIIRMSDGTARKVVVK